MGTELVLGLGWGSTGAGACSADAPGRVAGACSAGWADVGAQACIAGGWAVPMGLVWGSGLVLGQGLVLNMGLALGPRMGPQVRQHCSALVFQLCFKGIHQLVRALHLGRPSRVKEAAGWLDSRHLHYEVCGFLEGCLRLPAACSRHTSTHEVNLANAWTCSSVPAALLMARISDTSIHNTSARTTS